MPERQKSIALLVNLSHPLGPSLKHSRGRKASTFSLCTIDEFNRRKDDPVRFSGRRPRNYHELAHVPTEQSCFSVYILLHCIYPLQYSHFHLRWVLYFFQRPVTDMAKGMEQTIWGIILILLKKPLLAHPPIWHQRQTASTSSHTTSETAMCAHTSTTPPSHCIPRDLKGENLLVASSNSLIFGFARVAARNAKESLSVELIRARLLRSV